MKLFIYNTFLVQKFDHVVKYAVYKLSASGCAVVVGDFDILVEG